MAAGGYRARIRLVMKGQMLVQVVIAGDTSATRRSSARARARATGEREVLRRDTGQGARACRTAGA